ncbi:hypothetical protein LIER_25889 [Lithospermum erythrorhizon]|uniref:Uncharacterized protein n=1 Tax=Lithospermum erythrorhizon TaxID=34254 RepID=A0AAV3RCC4_LITER
MPSLAISNAFPQPPYLFSMPGMPSANDIGLSNDSLYPNSAMHTEGSGRDVRGFGQQFNPPQPWSFDEQLMANSQPSTSLGIGIGGKLKEAESGWESYPFKHHQQPWK